MATRPGEKSDRSSRHSLRQSPLLRGQAVPPAIIALPAVWPEVLLAVPADERPLAERLLVAPQLTVCDEDLSDVFDRNERTFCFAVVAGVVLKETTIRGWTALELLGPGDLLVPPLSEAQQLDAQAVSRYVAHGKVSIAGVDETFRQAARRWPGLSDLLHDRLAQQTHRASMNLAILHLGRVEDRVLALFSVLANRYGFIRGGIVHLDLQITHGVLGKLVGSRRPTVSLALRTLAAEHQIERLPDGTWQLDLSLVSEFDAPTGAM